MVRVSPTTTTDYLHVDGTESVILRRTGIDNVDVDYAKRSRIVNDNQLSGMEINDIIWDLPVAEMGGVVPQDGDTILCQDDCTWIIKAVEKQVVSQIWKCHTRKGRIA